MLVSTEAPQRPDLGVVSGPAALWRGAGSRGRRLTVVQESWGPFYTRCALTETTRCPTKEATPQPFALATPTHSPSPLTTTIPRRFTTTAV